MFSSPPSGYRLEVVFHSKEEDEEARRSSSDGEPYPYAPEYCCIAPLRLLWLRDSDPAAWARVQLLMDHDQERRREEKYWAMFRKNVVDFLIKKVGLTQFSEDEIFRIIGILRTNAFFVEDERLKKCG